MQRRRKWNREWEWCVEEVKRWGLYFWGTFSKQSKSVLNLKNSKTYTKYKYLYVTTIPNAIIIDLVSHWFGSTGMLATEADESYKSWGLWYIESMVSEALLE